MPSKLHSAELSLGDRYFRVNSSAYTAPCSFCFMFFKLLTEGHLNYRDRFAYRTHLHRDHGLCEDISE